MVRLWIDTQQDAYSLDIPEKHATVVETGPMGAGASAAAEDGPTFDHIGKWSKEEVGEKVAAIGEAFEKYKDIVVANGIDGATLLNLDDDALKAHGVALKPHRKKILKKVAMGF